MTSDNIATTDFFELWRLREHGHTVLGIGNIVLHRQPTSDVGLQKYNIILGLSDSDQVFIEPYLSRIEQSRVTILIQRRGSPFSKSPEAARQLGRALRALHSIKIPADAHILRNPLLDDGRYSLENVWASLYAHRLAQLRRPLRDAIIKMYDGTIRHCAIDESMCSIVHGGLHPLNVASFDDKIAFLDWESSRIDHYLTDVSQIMTQFVYDKEMMSHFSDGYGEVYVEQIMPFAFLGLVWNFIFGPHNSRFMCINFHTASIFPEFQEIVKAGYDT